MTHLTVREATPEERRAMFRVVRGEPSDAELAALTVALAAAASGSAEPRRAAGCDMWSDPAARMRGVLRPGPNAWRTSGWPP